MLKPFLQSSLSGLLTACFALSAFTWGSMPGCASAAGLAEAHASQEHHRAHHHQSDQKGQPSSPKCFVHLCCVQLATPTGTAQATAHHTAPERGLGFIAASRIVPVRPSHILPFAHAPPLS